MAYDIEELGSIEAEDLLRYVTSHKDLFNIDFYTDADNILLCKKLVELLYNRVFELESRINRLEKR